jgi:Pyruvate/2-oxoacid:ferredoxin oxidoreductase delta subunit
MRTRRTIVRIDEDKCNGCGQCATACAEGAIAIVDGKARLISETYCDGLGACLGECPQDAITTEVREAEEFDVGAVEAHLARQGKTLHAHPAAAPGFVCPSTVAESFDRAPAAAPETNESIPSRLANWPVQIRLVPPTAPYLSGARLVIAADCTPFAFPDFHRRFLGGRVLLIGCPKLDDAAFYREKLAQIIGPNNIQDIEVLYMEVPCCSGLVRIVRDAIGDLGQQIPLTLTKIGIHGEIKDRTAEAGGTLAAAGSKRD